MSFVDAMAPSGFYNRLTKSDGVFQKMVTGSNLDVSVVDTYVSKKYIDESIG